MARKPRPQKLRGFGLGEAGSGDAAPMGFVGALPREEVLDADAAAPVFSIMPPGSFREPLLRVANVGTLGAGIALHFAGVRHALVATLGFNLADIIGRQLSPQYRARAQLGPWNQGVM